MEFSILPFSLTLFLLSTVFMEDHLKGLSLVEEEDDSITYDVETNEDGVGDLALSLVGHFLTDRSIRVHIIKERMTKIWHPNKGVSIKQLENGVFLFQFFHHLDRQRVLSGGPWTFDNHLLILGCALPGDNLSQTPLNHVNFWV